MPPLKRAHWPHDDNPGCRGSPDATNGDRPADLSWKLWVYTNFHCNLRCSYCVAESTPAAVPRKLPLATVRRLVDEAVELNFQRIFLTGGEPLLLDQIYEMVAYAATRLPTTLLTNALLLKGRRWQRLQEVQAQVDGNLTVQVSLDGARAAHHDAYRGPGTWAKTVAGIRRLLDHGFHVCIGTTETPANKAHLAELETLRRDLGIPAEDHFVRPLARRGFATEGMEVGTHNLVPEITVTVDGVYWHPLISPGSGDMLVGDQIFPLAAAVDCIRRQLAGKNGDPHDKRTEFT
jgi:MoaA/NifB/PqqE/SkfB family radical SAM enzyme